MCVCVYIVSVDLFVNYTPQKQQLRVSKCCCSSRQQRRRRRRCWRRLPLLPEKVLTAGVCRAREYVSVHVCACSLSLSPCLCLCICICLGLACTALNMVRCIPLAPTCCLAKSFFEALSFLSFWLDCCFVLVCVYVTFSVCVVSLWYNLKIG